MNVVMDQSMKRSKNTNINVLKLQSGPVLDALIQAGFSILQGSTWGPTSLGASLFCLEDTKLWTGSDWIHAPLSINTL